MEKICISLTEKQTELLEDLFAELEAANGDGMIIGQFHASRNDDSGFFEVA